MARGRPVREQARTYHGNMTDDFAELTVSLRAMGLLAGGEACAIRALPGGVSCDVFLVEAEGRLFCVKRALAKLRVEADWRAPTERSHAEIAWMRLVAGIDPAWVPQILGEDRPRHLFAMQYFPPADFPLWKTQLAEGNADAGFAAQVGEALARIHSATVGRADIVREFANGAQFQALRIEPYLLYAAARNLDVAAPLQALAQNLAGARIALMHGDVSPKNILRGPSGPVFLDAETSCYGDPAFDLAFCLNHLLLKGVWHREHAAAYAASFAALTSAYFAKADWEARPALEARAAALLGALMLARIDGKSPVEYLTAERDKQFVRTMAKEFLNGAASLDAMLKRWNEALAQK